jgi:hypothetical protein
MSKLLNRATLEQTLYVETIDILEQIILCYGYNFSIIVPQ